MFIPSLMENHWSVTLLLEHLPHRCHQFQNTIYLCLWEWKTKYPSESMNKFYYDAQTQTLYPKLNKRYKDINQIIKDSTIKFELNSRSSVSSWRSFFYEIVYPITIFFNFPNLYQSLWPWAIESPYIIHKFFSRIFKKFPQNFTNTREVSTFLCTIFNS